MTDLFLSAMLTSLWLGAILALIARLLLRVFPRIGPEWRCGLWSGVLVCCFLAPLANQPRSIPTAPPASPDLPGGSAEGMEAGPEPNRSSLPERVPVAPSSSVVESPAAELAPVPAKSGSHLGSVTLAISHWWGGLVVALALLGVSAGLGFLAIQLWSLRQLKRSAEPPDQELLELWREAVAALSTGRRLRLLISPGVALPAACGYLQPAVLLPAGLMGGLAREQARQLLLHELAHLARYDDWALLTERVLLALAWWHPVAWYATRQLDAERELACDQLVADRSDRGGYARTLVQLAELAVAEPRQLAPGALRGEFARRIEALLDRSGPAHTGWHQRGSAGIAAATLALLGVWLIPPTIATRSAADGRTVAPATSLIPPDGRPVAAVLDALFSGFADSGLSGTILVARGDSVLLNRGYGLADRERRIPATAETRYSAAGMTKMFTAAAILTLQQEGGLRLSDSLTRWIGPLPGDKAGVTLHHLLTHTDGLARLSAPIFRRSPDDFIAALAATPPSFPPGQGYRYNDFGHSLLGLVVERRTGEPYERYVESRFLRPAGLTATGFEPGAGPIAIEYSGRTAALTPIPPRAYVWGRRGSLGMVTTTGDLFRWTRAMRDPQVLNPAALDLMFQPHTSTDWGAEQGYGWDYMPAGNGYPGVWRRVAGTPGMEGELLYCPEGDWTAVILLNSRLGWRFRVWREIRRAMAEAPLAVSR